MGNSRRTITGPGAADFLTSGAGEDLPGTSTTKGTGSLREDSELTNPRNLVPRLGPDDESVPGERQGDVLGPTKDERVTGSQTGTIGGGGPEAHNPSPVRATGEDDPDAAK